MKDTGVAFEATSTSTFAEAVARCRSELQREGFGVLTEIDIQAKLREKLGVELPPSVILGACHPPSALRALRAVPAVAVLLPCNVCVAVEDGRTVVRAMNPKAALSLLDHPEIASVADEVSAALARVVERASR